MKRPNDPKSVVREIKRQTRRKYTSEEKIRIVLEGLRGEESIAELCRREGINPTLYYNWSKEFLEADKKRLKGDTKREATSVEVVDLRSENIELKQLVADLSLEIRKLKKISGFLENGQVSLPFNPFKLNLELSWAESDERSPVETTVFFR
jgi:transposase